MIPVHHEFSSRVIRAMLTRGARSGLVIAQFEDHIILMYTRSEKRSSSFFVITYHRSSSRLPSISFLRLFVPLLYLLCSLRLERETRSESSSPISLIDWSIPSSRGWDGLRDRSVIRPFLSVGWYLTYIGERDDPATATVGKVFRKKIKMDLLLLYCYLIDQTSPLKTPRESSLHRSDYNRQKVALLFQYAGYGTKEDVPKEDYVKTT